MRGSLPKDLRSYVVDLALRVNFDQASQNVKVSGVCGWTDRHLGFNSFDPDAAGPVPALDLN